jgi:hypothetical protein
MFQFTTTVYWEQFKPESLAQVQDAATVAALRQFLPHPGFLLFGHGEADAAPLTPPLHYLSHRLPLSCPSHFFIKFEAGRIYLTRQHVPLLL